MIYFSELVVPSMRASVTVKRCLESEASTKIKWKKQSAIMSAVVVSVVNVLSTCLYGYIGNLSRSSCVHNTCYLNSTNDNSTRVF